MNILKKYLEKIGVEDYSELSQEEKDTYKGWEEALRGKKLTDEDVGIFLNTELNSSLDKLSPNLSAREDCFVKMKIEFIRKVKEFLKTPEMEKQMVEKNIEQLIRQ